jgi:hypothetical protein
METARYLRTIHDIDFVPAVYRDRTVLTELLLRFLNVSDEFNEAFTRSRYPLLGPISKLELTYGARLAILKINQFLSAYKMRNVQLSTD